MNNITRITEIGSRIAAVPGISRVTVEIVLSMSARPQRKVETIIINNIVHFIIKLPWFTGAKSSDLIWFL
jgi:hypothetical protein